MLSNFLHYGLKNLGWFSAQDALKLTGSATINSNNPTIIGLYEFAVCDEKPNNDLFPWEVKSVVDIGKAGDGEAIRADYKAGFHKSPYLKTALYDRISSHITEYNPNKKDDDKQSESAVIIRNMLREDNTKQLWVCILHYETPNIDLTRIHTMPDLTIELLTCESESILEYKNIWGVPPIGNPGAKGRTKYEKRKKLKRKKSQSESHFTQVTLSRFIK